MSPPVDRSGPAPPRRGGERLVVGRLKAHGRANYQFRAHQDPSYYLTLQTDRGPKTLWGKDLERALAFAATQPKVDDLIGVQRLAREAVTLVERKRDAHGQLVSQREIHAHRTRWRVEKLKFFTDRARQARQVRDAQVDARETLRAHPELKSTFLTLRAATEFAAQRIGNTQDRAHFLALLRGAMAGSIKQGEPLPEVRLRERGTGAAPARTPDPKKREEPTR